MQATCRKSGPNFLPVIVHDNGRRETLYGPPLSSECIARKYAQLEINLRALRRKDTYVLALFS